MIPFKTAEKLIRGSSLLALALILFTWWLPRTAAAAPEAKILRIDPRASQTQGDPVLTSVIEIVQAKRVSEATASCAGAKGTALYDCMSGALEAPNALYTSFSPFPETNAIFSVTVDGTDLPAKFVRQAKWGDSLQKPGVGTAWLIMIDADSRMGKSFDDARSLARAFVAAMGPNDIVNVMFFNDRQVVSDSKWLSAAQRSRAEGFINGVTGTYSSSGRNRALFTIVKSGATDGFRALGDAGQSGVTVPLHQAMVLLSSGFGGTDPSTTGPVAMQLSQYLSNGRFPEDNTALPKMPVPIVSVFFPHATWEEFKQNSLEFMQNLANPQIGGFFTIMRAGQGGRSPQVVNTVRTRFSKMHIVEWRVSCVAPTIEQTFKLVFKNVNPPILGDNTFKEVPTTIDPTTWPLDVDLEATRKAAEGDGDAVYPGGRLKVFGNFCWGGEEGRAEVYFLPAGQALPAELASTDVEKAKRTQQQLIAMGMKGTTIEASSSSAEFQAPDKDKILHGSGSKAVVRLVVYDNKAHRVSGVTANRIIELKAGNAPFPVLYVLIGAFALVVLLLLIVAIVRIGSGRRRAAPAPAPVVSHYGGYPPPGGYGAPAAGGFGAMPPGAMPGAVPAGAGYVAMGAVPAGAGGAPAAPMGAAPVSPGFMYGAGGQAPNVGVTGAIGAMGAGAPPPDPYAAAPAVITRAVLQGGPGVFTVTPGIEMRIGRDGAQCAILLTEPRVSGVHATVRIDAGQLQLRDDNSNNGTVVNGTRLAPGVWTPVPNGSLVRFGPVEFSIRLE